MSLFDDAASTILSKPKIARLATNGKDGYPHVVPLWFILDGDDLVVISERTAVKVKNLQRDPRGALTIGGDEGDGAGYTAFGTFTISDDTGNAMTNRITRHYESPEEAEKHVEEWKSLDMVELRMKVERVIKVY